MRGNSMPCNTLVEPACRAASSIARSAATGAANGILDALARAVTTGVRWVVVNTSTWWVQLPSPDLAANPAVGDMQHWMLPVTAAVAAGGVIAAGVRMAVTR